NAGCNLIKNVHRVVLEKVQIRCNSRRNVSDTVIMEKAHRHIPQPVAQCNPFSGYKLKACRTLQPVNQIFENHAQDETSCNQADNNTPCLSCNRLTVLQFYQDKKDGGDWQQAEHGFQKATDKAAPNPFR